MTPSQPRGFMELPIQPTWESDCGTVKLWLGDCLKIIPSWPVGAVDAVVTDPPYGIGGYVSAPSKWRRRKGLAAEQWDNATVDIFAAFSKSKRQMIWGGNNYALPPSRNFACWYKPDSPPSMADCEYAWCSWDGNSIHITHSISATNRERTGHPTQKPLEVMRRSILHAGGQSIADPFSGSGTTAKMAKHNGRHFIGLEVNPDYCEIARKRLRQGYMFGVDS